MSEQIRLNKFLAERLGISRRQADDLIAKKQVKIGEKTAILGDRIDKFDEVCYNGRIVPFSVGYSYYALNKPVGYVCSRKRQGNSPTIFELLPAKMQDLKTVGRLDYNSSGLILLTNDGDFNYQMTHPKFVKTKVYQVELDRELEPLHQQEIADFGIEIGDGISKLGLARLEPDDPNLDGIIKPDGSRKFWQVTMSEGRNRQIRRTFSALGYEVVKLHRIQFGPYQLSGLKPGEFVEFQK